MEIAAYAIGGAVTGLAIAHMAMIVLRMIRGSGTPALSYVVEDFERQIESLDRSLHQREALLAEVKADLEKCKKDLQESARLYQEASASKDEVCKVLSLELEECREESSRLESAYEAQSAELESARCLILELKEYERGLLVTIDELKTAKNDFEFKFGLAVGTFSKFLERLSSLSRDLDDDAREEIRKIVSGMH